LGAGSLSAAQLLVPAHRAPLPRQVERNRVLRRLLAWDRRLNLRAPPRPRVDLEAAADRRDAVAQAAQAGTRRGVGTADTVVGDLHEDLPAVASHADCRMRRLRIPGDVGERLGNDEVGRGLNAIGQALGRRLLELDRQRSAAGQPIEGRAKAAIGEYRGMDAAGELS
jgi:hypothetical protein